MLTIQTGFSNKNFAPMFSHNEDNARIAEHLVYDPISGNYVTVAKSNELMAERRQVAFKDNFESEAHEYDETKSFLEGQREEFNNLINDKDVPSIFKKAMKVITVGISSVLGGMAMVWGSKKSMGAIETLVKTKKAQSVAKKTQEGYRVVKNKVVDSYRYIANSKIGLAISRKVDKLVGCFNNSKVGRNKYVKVTMSGVKAINKSIIKDYNDVVGKIKKVNIEKVKNTTANVMGVSGGVTSGVAAIQEAKKEDSGKEVA